MKKKYTFTILTWNRLSMLSICLPALYNSIQEKNNCEIIILDNHSSDGTWDFLKVFKDKNRDLKIRILRAPWNLGLTGYKILFFLAKGDKIVEVDDDVLMFPDKIDSIFSKYINSFPDFGFIALDVIQNELTNGAKPSPASEHYIEIERENLIMEQGQTGGWCSCFDKKRIPMFLFYLKPINFKSGDDGLIVFLNKLMGLKSGIIKGIKCLHASGPIYSKEYGLIQRDIEKYKKSGLDDFVDNYREYQ